MAVPHIIAVRAELAQARLIAHGVVAARRETARVRQHVIAAYKRGRIIQVRDSIIQELSPVLIDVMVALNVKGREFAQTLRADAKRREIKLAQDPRLRKIVDKLHNKSVVDALRAQYRTQALTILAGVGDDIEAKLRRSLGDAIASGATLKDGIKALEDGFTSAGVAPKNTFQLETIFRTQSQVAFNAGRWQDDQDPDIQDILWGYEYVTVGDDRVRPTHAALDGMKLPKGDPFWQTFWPPNGWNCRCTVAPIFEPVQIKRPPAQLDDGTLVTPDKGFELNFGLATAV